MLHKQLEQAQKEEAQKRRLSVLAIIAACFVVILIAVSTSLYKEVHELRGELSSITAPPDATPSPRADISASPDAVPTISKPKTSPPPLAVKKTLPEKNTIEQNTPEKKTAVPQPPSTNNFGRNQAKPETGSTLIPSDMVEPPSASTNPEAREFYKKALTSFENALEPGIRSDDFYNWRPEIQRDILFLKESSITEFGNGDYDKAQSLLEDAQALAEKNLEEKKAAFANAMENARNAKANDDYKTAKTSIERALKLDSASTQARDLKEEIEKLPAIVKHLEAAKIARVENNLEKELSHLREALKRDPDRSDLRERATFLATKIKEKRFTNHIASGFEHTRNRQLSDAIANLKMARQLYPNRSEIALLNSKVVELERDLKVDEYLSAAKAATVADNWLKSLDYFAKAKQLHGDNQHAIDGHALSLSITSIDRAISQHLKEPDRLGSPNVAKSVAALLEKANQYAGASKSLDQHARDLSRVLDSYSEEIPIRVVSDGFTNISVRGVGRVGVVKEKTISLTPGTYTFEGARAGYQSKLLRVNIPPDSVHFTVEIICDEKI